MKKITFLISITLMCAIITSCNPKTEGQAFDLNQAKTEIETVNKEFMDLFAKGDSVGLANCYTVDAKLMIAGAPAVTGRQDIQTAVHGMVNSGITKADIKTFDVWGTEALLAEEGEVLLYVKDTQVAQEKFIVLWKKEDGKWKLFRDIFNSNLPVK